MGCMNHALIQRLEGLAAKLMATTEYHGYAHMILEAAEAAKRYQRLVEALRRANEALALEGHLEGLSRALTNGRALLRELGEVE